MEKLLLPYALGPEECVKVLDIKINDIITWINLHEDNHDEDQEIKAEDEVKKFGKELKEYGWDLDKLRKLAQEAERADKTFHGTTSFKDIDKELEHILIGFSYRDFMIKEAVKRIKDLFK